MKKLYLALALAASVLGLALAVPAAHAASGNYWCNSDAECFNAWSYGPGVKSYAPGYQADDFTVVGDYNECNGGYTTSSCPGGYPAGLPIVQFQFTGGGSYNGDCVGDAYNLSTRADAQLGGCSASEGGSGTGWWGSNFVQYPANTSGCSSGYAAFWNTHWTGTPAWQPGYDNGEQVYLNGTPGWCLKVTY